MNSSATLRKLPPKLRSCRPSKAAAYVTKRRAETSLIEFVKQAWPLIESKDFVYNWHVKVICDHLEMVTRGEIKNLLINIPPGTSKSTICCVMWPAWEWGPAGQPFSRWFFASYDAKLSTRDSVKCRTIIRSKWYQDRWGERVSICPEQDQKTYYETTAGGYRLATSVGGHGTGQHPSRILIDDPHNVKKAESAKERQAVVDWHKLTMSTRGMGVKPARVCIMQRLHEQDLSAEILKEGDWLHLCFPMRYEKAHPFVNEYSRRLDARTEEGQLLAPQYMPDEVVRKTERILGTYGTAGQFQQRPAPRTGGFFETSRFVKVTEAELPEDWDALVRWWDKAGSDKANADYTAGVLLGRKDAKVYVLDVVRGQWSAGKVEDKIEETAEQDRRKYGGKVRPWFEEEGGSAGKLAAEVTRRNLEDVGAQSERSTGSKETYAHPWSIKIENGEVYVLEAPWTFDFIAEHQLFPAGANDDQVDAASKAFLKLSKPKKRWLVADPIKTETPKAETHPLDFVDQQQYPKAIGE